MLYAINPMYIICVCLMNIQFYPVIVEGLMAMDDLVLAQ